MAQIVSGVYLMLEGLESAVNQVQLNREPTWIIDNPSNNALRYKDNSGNIHYLYEKQLIEPGSGTYLRSSGFWTSSNVFNSGLYYTSSSIDTLLSGINTFPEPISSGTYLRSSGNWISSNIFKTNSDNIFNAVQTENVTNIQIDAIGDKALVTRGYGETHYKYPYYPRSTILVSDIINDEYYRIFDTYSTESGPIDFQLIVFSDLPDIVDQSLKNPIAVIDIKYVGIEGTYLGNHWKYTVKSQDKFGRIEFAVIGGDNQIHMLFKINKADYLFLVANTIAIYGKKVSALVTEVDPYGPIIPSGGIIGPTTQITIPSDFSVTEYFDGIQVLGQYANTPTSDQLVIIGNGSDVNNRSNGFIQWRDGSAELSSVTNAIINARGPKAIASKDYVDTSISGIVSPSGSLQSLSGVLQVGNDGALKHITNVGKLDSGALVQSRHGIWQVAAPTGGGASVDPIIPTGVLPSGAFMVSGATHNAGGDPEGVNGLYNTYPGQFTSWQGINYQVYKHSTTPSMYISRYESYWLVGINYITPAWDNARLYGAENSSTPVGMFQGSWPYIGTAIITSTIGTTTFDLAVGSGIIESIMTEGDIYSDTIIKSRQGFKTGNTLLDNTGIKKIIPGSSGFYLTINDNGSVSLPLCPASGITSPRDLVTLEKMQLMSPTLSGVLYTGNNAGIQDIRNIREITTDGIDPINQTAKWEIYTAPISGSITVIDSKFNGGTILNPSNVQGIYIKTSDILYTSIISSPQYYIQYTGWDWVICSNISDPWNTAKFYGAGGSSTPMGIKYFPYKPNSATGYVDVNATTELIFPEAIATNGSIFTQDAFKTYKGLEVKECMAIGNLKSVNISGLESAGILIHGSPSGNYFSIGHLNTGYLLNITNSGSITAPNCEINDINTSKTLTTKEYVDTHISGIIFPTINLSGVLQTGNNAGNQSITNISGINYDTNNILMNNINTLDITTSGFLKLIANKPIEVISSSGLLMMNSSSTSYASFDPNSQTLPLLTIPQITAGSNKQIVTKEYVTSINSTISGLVPSSGTINQVLTKNSSTNYDYSWKSPTSTNLSGVLTTGNNAGNQQILNVAGIYSTITNTDIDNSNSGILITKNYVSSKYTELVNSNSNTPVAPFPFYLSTGILSASPSSSMAGQQGIVIKFRTLNTLTVNIFEYYLQLATSTMQIAIYKGSITSGTCAKLYEAAVPNNFSGINQHILTTPITFAKNDQFYMVFYCNATQGGAGDQLGCITVSDIIRNTALATDNRLVWRIVNNVSALPQFLTQTNCLVDMPANGKIPYWIMRN